MNIIQILVFTIMVVMFVVLVSFFTSMENGSEEPQIFPEISGLTEENFNLIHCGTSIDDVITILGEPISTKHLNSPNYETIRSYWNKENNLVATITELDKYKGKIGISWLKEINGDTIKLLTCIEQ